MYNYESTLLTISTIYLIFYILYTIYQQFVHIDIAS